MITPIRNITPIMGGEASAKTEQKPSESMFADVFHSAIDNVKTTETDVVNKEYLLATGQLDNPAELSIAQAKSSIAVDLLVQLRNKSLEAYNEITRMSI